MEESLKNKINNFWSKKSGKGNANLKLRWWQSPYIIRAINKKVCGVACDGFSQGLINLAKERSKGRIYNRGISVGCGNGNKEMELIKQGLVSEFTLYELADERIKAGRLLAQQSGLEAKVKFIKGDAFETETREGSYDFVHWNNSLHHMMDVDEAVKWSYAMLEEGGMFYMDDYVGPSRFQWTDKMLEIVNQVRMTLPEKYLSNPHTTSNTSLRTQFKKTIYPYKKNPVLLSRLVTRPTIEQMISTDPSEAADSARIISSIEKYFPQAEIILTGGTIYHLALNDIIYNFDEQKDRHLLDFLMMIDSLCAELGENHYATAIAFKIR